MHWLELAVFGSGILWLVAQLVIFAWIERPGILAIGSGQHVAEKGSKILALVKHWPWLRVGASRAVGETVAFQIGLSASLLGLALALPARESLQTISSLLILDGPCCILWCALRLRLPVGRWWRKILYESAIAAALALALLPLLLIAAFTILLLKQALPTVLEGTRSFPALLAEGLEHYPQILFALLAISIGALVLFLMFRIGIRLWLRWNQMRRTRLRWALTHAHLLVVVIGAALLGALLVGVDMLTSTGFPFYFLSILVALAIFTSLALAIVLPPSALFSYLFARKMTRRIEALASAAGALRQGEYGIRVPVMGEDEIARLQADFNAMAADLERTMRELQEERDAVATLLKARRELIASVSHELRTPIATLRGYLESTRTHWDATPPPTLRQDLQVMEQETIRLQTLIDDLFTLSRAEVGRLELRCQTVDAGALARRVAATMAPLAWQAGRVEVIAGVDCAAPLVFADPCRLEQALHNLAHNGVRHTPPGGIVALLVQAAAAAVTLQVKDTGEGIAPADLPRIWERFYRAESSRAHSDNGSGLGLALVKELTEAMGGSVGVESVPGEGSCFTLRFPRVNIRQESLPIPLAQRNDRLDKNNSGDEVAQAPTLAKGAK
jgi:signal transduction histidine kinase